MEFILTCCCFVVVLVENPGNSSLLPWRHTGVCCCGPHCRTTSVSNVPRFQIHRQLPCPVSGAWALRGGGPWNSGEILVNRAGNNHETSGVSASSCERLTKASHTVFYNNTAKHGILEMNVEGAVVKEERSILWISYAIRVADSLITALSSYEPITKQRSVLLPLILKFTEITHQLKE